MKIMKLTTDGLLINAVLIAIALASLLDLVILYNYGPQIEDCIVSIYHYNYPDHDFSVKES